MNDLIVMQVDGTWYVTEDGTTEEAIGLGEYVFKGSHASCKRFLTWRKENPLAKDTQ